MELNKVVNFRKIVLINEEKAKTEKLIEINISIKKDIIYLFYIIKSKYNDKIKYYLKYKIYNNTMINLNNKEENNHIEFSEFIPIRLINDSKYLYCFSTTEKFFVLKLNCKFNQFNISKYAIYKFDFKNFKMYNTFYINNYLIIENIENNKQYSAIINKNINEEYTFKIIEIKNEKELEYNKNNNFIINITFNDNKYVITKIDTKKLLLYYKVIENDGKNEYFSFPFSDSYLNYQTDNCYDKYLKEICFILNMFGNNNKNSIINIIQISSYFKLMKNDLDYIIQNIKNNKEFDKVKLYNIIFLRSIIKCLIHFNQINKFELKNLTIFFKQLIIEGYKTTNKYIYYKILKEIIIIYSYMKQSPIVELNEIKFILNEKNDIKSQLLILKLLLEQEQTNKEIII